MKEPTEAEIKQLQNNCYNISLWLDHVHDFLQDVLNEVYLKLSQDSGGDPGQDLVTKINDVTFAIIGDVDFPGAAITNYAIGSLMGSYDPDPPDPLKKVFGDVWGRFGATFQQAEDDFGNFATDPLSHWNDTYTDPTSGHVFHVYDLARDDVFFPSRDPHAPDGFYNPDAFNELTDRLKSAFKYQLAKNVMGKKWSILHSPNNTFWDGWNENDARRFAEDQVKANRDIIVIWWADQGGSCAGCPSNGMSTTEPRIGVGEWYSSWDFYHGESAPQDMCDWLMQDDDCGNILNPSALTTRHDVFYNWPLDGNLSDHPVRGVERIRQDNVPQESKARAKQWHKLLAEKSRAQIEAEIVQKYFLEPSFRAKLVKDPKSTLEEHLGIQMPEEVEVEVIQELPGRYKILIPYVGRPIKSP